MTAWTKEIKAYRKFQGTSYEAMHDLRFSITRYLNRCIDDGLTPDTQEGIEEITHHVKTKMWAKYKEEVGIEDVFSSEDAFWQHVKTHKGGRGRVDAAIHGCLEQESHMRWALSAGLCDGRDAQGRSVLHAASLVQSTDVSEQAVLTYLKWKDQQNKWKIETKDSVESFIASVIRAKYDTRELCLEMAQILEKHQPEDMAAEYTQKLKNKTVLITFGVALWMGAGRKQSDANRNRWLERLSEWEDVHGWTEKEVWHLTAGFEKLPQRLQSALLSSKSKVERLILNQKCAVEKPLGYETVGLAL